AHLKDSLVILLSNFNADPSRTHNLTNSKELFDLLNNLYLINKLDLVKKQKSTHDLVTYITNTSCSTIDHIFIHSILVPDLIDQEIIKVDNNISDHAI
ncbi:5212_t:CDS:1, partial [Funneliformis caledonium]